MNNGHTFHLWVYRDLNHTFDEGVVVKDANEILPEEAIFQYENESTSGWGKGSVAGFSDIFRYKLLYERGGWWVDMDVTCLREFDFPSPYVFRSHNELEVIGNVMKCAQGSELMKACYQEASGSIDQFNQDWLKPVRILNDQIKAFNMRNYIQEDLSIPDHMGLTNLLIYSKLELPDKYYFIHWLNEKWRELGIDKDSYMDGSSYFTILEQNRLVHLGKKRSRRDVKTYYSKGKAMVYKFILGRPYLFFLLKSLSNTWGRLTSTPPNKNPQTLSKDLLQELGLTRKK